MHTKSQTQAKVRMLANLLSVVDRVKMLILCLHYLQRKNKTKTKGGESNLGNEKSQAKPDHVPHRVST